MSDQLPEVRISDAERERFVDILRRHCGEGRLTLDEFSDRVGHVFGARTVADAQVALADLPVPELPLGTGAAVPRRRAAARRLWAIMSQSYPRGRWRVSGELTAISVLGSTVIDLRQAEVETDEVVITAVAVLGSVFITVPEGIDVELEGIAIMGSKGGRIRNVPVVPGTPTVRIRAYPVMGSVWVRTPPRPGEPDSWTGETARARGPHRHDHHGARYASASVGAAPAAPPAPSAPPAKEKPQKEKRPRHGIEAVAADAAASWPSIRPGVAPDGTVTIMFSDIEGFTAINERLGDYRMQSILRDHNKIVRQKLDEYDGFEVKVNGDGFMVAFSSAARALRCAVALQEALTDYNDDADEPVRVRIGLHTGEAIRDADDFLGSTVNLASRIAEAARGEEIFVSALLRELCAPTGEFTFDQGREMDLKGLSRPHRVYTVLWR
jgi:class 3 adenylate cyclase